MDDKAKLDYALGLCKADAKAVQWLSMFAPFPATFSEQTQQVLIKYLGETNGTHLYNQMNPTNPVYRTYFNKFG